jgi:hypothetical protein
LIQISKFKFLFRGLNYNMSLIMEMLSSWTTSTHYFTGFYPSWTTSTHYFTGFYPSWTTSTLFHWFLPIMNHFHTLFQYFTGIYQKIFYLKQRVSVLKGEFAVVPTTKFVGGAYHQKSTLIWTAYLWKLYGTWPTWLKGHIPQKFEFSNWFL